jgi:Protein of unknown function (DUF3164)
MNIQQQAPDVVDRAIQRTAPAIDTGITEIGDKQFMRDARNRFVPLELVKPEHKLEDQTVRSIVSFAEELSAQISRFRGHTFDDVTSFIELLAARYGATRGGRKGNITLTSYDGCLKVTVQVQEQLTFGPELQIAKQLVDACITDWSADSRPEIRALVEHAFQVDKEGRINRSALFALRRLDIDDEHWRKAMTALSDAIRVIGSKEYVRFHRRPNNQAPWEPIVIDLAGVS